MDHSKSIDKAEAVRHWGKGFAKVSANEFFKAVDMNKEGAITFEEFKTFWQVVKNAGHSENDICEELDRIKNGESWVGFNNLPTVDLTKSVKHNMIKIDHSKE